MDTAERGTDGRFVPGNRGKPRGARNRATLAVQEALEGQVDRLTAKVVELALEGDPACLRMCLDRLSPPRRDRSIEAQLPPVATAADHPAALAAIVEAVAIGDISPSEGHAFAGILAEHRKAIEVGELEQRIAALEARVK